jgi:hypothetical protein
MEERRVKSDKRQPVNGKKNPASPAGMLSAFGFEKGEWLF